MPVLSSISFQTKPRKIIKTISNNGDNSFFLSYFNYKKMGFESVTF